MATTPTKAQESTITVQQLADAEALRLQTEKASEEAAALAASIPQPPAAPERKLLVSGMLADQVNPLTHQRIQHSQPTLAVFDRWIEIQIEAGVLFEVPM